MPAVIATFESGTDGFSSVTRDTGTGANGTSASVYTTNPAEGDVSPDKFIDADTATEGELFEFWVKLPGADVILSGDASAVAFEQGGWRWCSLYNYVNRSSTAWQKVSIPLTHFTADGNSSPGSPGTGTPFDPTASATFKFRFWNNVSYNWYFDEIAFVSSSPATIVKDIIGGGIIPFLR